MFVIIAKQFSAPMEVAKQLIMGETWDKKNRYNFVALEVGKKSHVVFLNISKIM